MMLRPLVLTGGPAVGKSTCGRALASERNRAAFIDVDDIRQLVVAGDATGWTGAEGEAQLSLSAQNAASLARNFHRAGFDVVIADFVTADSLAVYRNQLAECFVIHLRISLDGALARASTRKVYLTDDEFVLLHEMIASPPAADLVLEVDDLSLTEQIGLIRRAWHGSGSARAG